MERGKSPGYHSKSRKADPGPDWGYCARNAGRKETSRKTAILVR